MVNEIFPELTQTLELIKFPTGRMEMPSHLCLSVRAEQTLEQGYFPYVLEKLKSGLEGIKLKCE